MAWHQKGRQAFTLTNDSLVYRRIYASLYFDELKPVVLLQRYVMIWLN